MGMNHGNMDIQSKTKYSFHPKTSIQWHSSANWCNNQRMCWDEIFSLREPEYQLPGFIWHIKNFPDLLVFAGLPDIMNLPSTYLDESTAFGDSVILLWHHISNGQVSVRAMKKTQCYITILYYLLYLTILNFYRISIGASTIKHLCGEKPRRIALSETTTKHIPGICLAMICFEYICALHNKSIISLFTITFKVLFMPIAVSLITRLTVYAASNTEGLSCCTQEYKDAFHQFITRNFLQIKSSNITSMRFILMHIKSIML